MKREYSYGSIMMINFLGGLITLALNLIFSKVDPKRTNLIFNIIILALIWFVSFLVTAGLINNRKGRVGDYLNQAKRINLKVVIIALLLNLINWLISLIFNDKLDSIKQATNNFISIGGAIIILIYAILTTYTLCILADPRNKDKSIGHIIKDIFFTGVKLIGKTIKVYFLYIIIPLVSVYILFFIILIGFNKDSLTFFLSMSLLIGVVTIIYTLFIGPVVFARISDNYLDYKSDIEDPMKEDKGTYTITRSM